MSIPISLSNLSNLNNPTTAVSTINSNNTAIAQAFENSLFTSGDQMLGSLDMNSNQILNLPAPGTLNSPLRLADMSGIASAVTNTISLEYLRASDFGFSVGNSAASNATFLQNALSAGTGVGKKVLIAPGSYNCNKITVSSYTGLVGYTPSAVADGIPPSSSSIQAPAFLISDTSGSFITINGPGSLISGLMFYYPNQIGATSTSNPVAYSSTILVSQNVAPQTVLQNLTSINAYDFINIQCGRVTVRDCLIGALHNGIIIDGAADFVFIQNVMNQVMWDVATGLTYPQNLDNWVLSTGSGGSALVIGRADSVHINNFGVFSKFAGITLQDTTLGLSPPSSYGNASNLDFDTVVYGILAKSTNGRTSIISSATSTPGWRFSNVIIGASGQTVGTTAQTGIFLPSGGSSAPDIRVTNVDIRGTWAVTAPYAINAGRLSFDSAYGLGQQGLLATANPAPPAVPSSNTAVTSPYPFRVGVYINAGTAVSAIKINGSGLGTQTSAASLSPGDTISLTYSSAPTWTWFGE